MGLTYSAVSGLTYLPFWNRKPRVSLISGLTYSEFSLNLLSETGPRCLTIRSTALKMLEGNAGTVTFLQFQSVLLTTLVSNKKAYSLKMKCYSTVAMAFKNPFVAMCSCQDTSQVMWIYVLYAEHVTTRKSFPLRTDWFGEWVYGLIKSLDFLAVVQEYSLIPSRCIFFCLMEPHISPIIVVPPPVSWGAQPVPRGSLTLSLRCQMCQKLQFGNASSALMATFTYCVVCQDYRLSDLNHVLFPLFLFLKFCSFLWGTKLKTHTDANAHKPLENPQELYV